jgi:hypothetical protein
MFFEVLVKCSVDDDTLYDHYYISEAENIEEVTKRASDFISTYYADDGKGTLLVDHDNIAYRFYDGELVEILQINETTPEEFLKNRTGKMFWIS